MRIINPPNEKSYPPILSYSQMGISHSLQTHPGFRSLRLLGRVWHLEFQSHQRPSWISYIYIYIHTYIYIYNVIQHIAGASSVQHFARHRLHRYTGYSGCTMPWGALDLGRSFYDDTGIYWALQLEKTEECGPWPNWQTGKISIYLSI